jgi:hypothetical protein
MEGTLDVWCDGLVCRQGIGEVYCNTCYGLYAMQDRRKERDYYPRLPIPMHDGRLRVHSQDPARSRNLHHWNGTAMIHMLDHLDSGSFASLQLPSSRLPTWTKEKRRQRAVPHSVCAYHVQQQELILRFTLLQDSSVLRRWLGEQ